MLLREMFRYELKKGFAEVSFHAAVTLAVSTWSIILSVFFSCRKGLLCIHWI